MTLSNRNLRFGVFHKIRDTTAWLRAAVSRSLWNIDATISGSHLRLTL